jgi:acylphosphatase
MNHEMIAIDVRIPGNQINSGGIAYYRIDPEFRDFMKKCVEECGVIGFSYNFDDLNFGVVLKSPDPAPTKSEEVKKVEEVLAQEMLVKETEIKAAGKKEIK